MLVNTRYPYVRGQCDEAFLELRFNPVPKQTILDILQRIGSKTITNENFFLMKNREFLSQR